MLKSKKVALFNVNDLKNYKINLQQTYSHQNMSNLDNDLKLLLQINCKKVFEVDEKKLDEMIIKLKEVYNKIKI